MLIGLLAFAPLVSVAGESDIVRLQFREVDTLMATPGQGWMHQQRSPRGEPRFPCSVVYIRFNWADAQPEEGSFNWKMPPWQNLWVRMVAHARKPLLAKLYKTSKLQIDCPPHTPRAGRRAVATAFEPQSSRRHRSPRVTDSPACPWSVPF